MDGSFAGKDRNRIDAILEHLKSLSKDVHITLKKVAPGSVILTIRSTKEGFQAVKDLVRSGKLVEVEDLKIKEVPAETQTLPATSPIVKVSRRGRVPVFQKERYFFDAKSGNAELVKGALLYRITSMAHVSRRDLLNGGASLGVSTGRFNHPHQLTTYCSTNILTGIAEVLFARYRAMLEMLERQASYSLISHSVVSRRVLVGFSVRHVDGLAFLDSKHWWTGVPGMPSLLIHPDAIRRELVMMSDRLRAENMNGVVYPSARHSEGYCLAMFGDQSLLVSDDFYTVLPLELRLIAESQDLRRIPKVPDPLNEHLHGITGYYSFKEAGSQLDKALRVGALNPYGLPPAGYVDFVREKYTRYPDDAVVVPRLKALG